VAKWINEPYMSKEHYGAMYEGCKSNHDAKTGMTYGITMQKNYFNNYLQAFLFINYLTKH
jgi:hypothetical protein